MAQQGGPQVKTARQRKHRARARLARWIRDGRPARLQKGFSFSILSFIATNPGEEGISADALRYIGRCRMEEAFAAAECAKARGSVASGS